jgi:NTE family protein
MSMNLFLRARILFLFLLSFPFYLLSQSPVPIPGSPSSPVSTQNPSTAPTDNKSAQIPPSSESEEDETTLGKPLDLPSTAPAPAPPNNNGRPRIGLALGGGGALGLTEIGALQWFEEHHIPVDVIAGTSMGCMISSLYSTGKTPEQLKSVMNDTVFNSVFSFNPAFKSRNFRRREDERELPNALTIGLRHGVSLRNSVLTDQGLNAFLTRQFQHYDDRVEFNDLPIPLRCLSTDLTVARTVTFARGSLPNAVRASISIPAVFPPVTIEGHQFVDGAVLENLPTQTVHDMKADVVIAFSMPMGAYETSDVQSIFGVLGRSFAVAIEGNERESRRLADVVITPDVKGFGQADYLKAVQLAQRGYDATEKHKDRLLKYAVSDEQWQAYLEQRAARRPHPSGNILRIRVKAPNDSVTRVAQRKFNSLVNKPINTDQIEDLLSQLRSGGQYDAGYSIGYDPDAPAADADRPVVLVTISQKQMGPPFLLLGFNIAAMTSNITQATMEGIFLWQGIGGYGSEFRAHMKIGYRTDLEGEYYYRFLNIGKTGGFFVAPNADLLRDPFYIYSEQHAVSQRLRKVTGGGGDIGWSDAHTQEIRLGWQGNHVQWTTEIGSDTLSPPTVEGGVERVRIRYAYDSQDRALVPQYGIRTVTEFGYQYNAVESRDAPFFTSRLTIPHHFGKNLVFFGAEGGTLFNRNVAQPFRYTLGGPLRLTASAFDEYRGTDYFLVEPAYLRRIAKLPDPFGQSIYVGIGYEAGQMRAPDFNTITRQDVYFGIVAETPVGVITLAPAIGDAGHRKLVFTLGKLF